VSLSRAAQVAHFDIFALEQALSARSQAADHLHRETLASGRHSREHGASPPGADQTWATLFPAQLRPGFQVVKDDVFEGLAQADQVHTGAF
jgi:hypothetical protein